MDSCFGKDLLFTWRPCRALKLASHRVGRQTSGQVPILEGFCCGGNFKWMGKQVILKVHQIFCITFLRVLKTVRSLHAN